MIRKILFYLFPLFLLTLFFSSANYGINAKAAGNVPPLSPPYEPGYTPLYQNGTTPQCRQDACIGACTLEIVVWGRSATFETYMNKIRPLTGCDKGELGAAFDAAFDVASELASMDTGAFLNCGEVWAGTEYADCTPTCENTPCRYAPDLSVSRTDTDPISDQPISISLGNSVASTGLDTTAITGGIDVFASIRYTGVGGVGGWDEAIPYAKYELPSLGYPRLGWSTNAAATCTDNSDHRCDFLNTLAAAQLHQEITIPIPPQEGVYNLANLVSSSAGVDNLSSGFAELIQGGDSVTMIPGLSGITYVREDFNWNGVWDNLKVEVWNSWSGAYTISNAECKDWCWFSGKQRVNRDKFVIVLDGPCESLLLGDYTLSVEAPLDHDQNINNNSIEVPSYSLDSVPSGCGVNLDSAPIEATLTQGDHDLAFDREFIKYYRVVVPEDASLLEVVLEGPNSSNSTDNLDLLLRRGSAPETTRQGLISFDYIAQDAVGYKDKLRIQVPEPGEWFIEVYQDGLLYTNNFKLDINIESSTTPIVDLEEGQYALSLKSGQTSQIFRLHSFSQLENLKVSFDPSMLSSILSGSPKIYICLGGIPPIHYEHFIFPGPVCGIAFNAGGWLHPFSKQVNITSPASGSYFILVERTSGLVSLDYNLNIDFTWPASTGLEVEPNDSCENANPWNDEYTLPKRGFFYPSGDQDFYRFVLGNDTGGSTEMEAYLASVPSNIKPDLIVTKKVGTTYEPVQADLTAASGGSPLVRFDMFYGQEYCIQVKSRDSAQNRTDPYSLYVRYADLATTGETEVEPNDTPEEASLWGNMDNAMWGDFSSDHYPDFFQWNAKISGVYFLAVNRTPTVPTHYLWVYKRTGVNLDIVYPPLNEGHNQDDIDPVGLTFYAEAGTNYLFKLYPTDPSVESGMYKLTLQHLDDYGATCSGAAMLNLGFVNPTSGSLSNTITSQLTQDDQDCFHIKPATVSCTLVLPQSPDSIPLVELFRYNPNAFDSRDGSPTSLGQFTFTSGTGQNGEYTMGFRFTPDSFIEGLTYQFPVFTANEGYCACISTGNPDGDGGHSGGSRDDWQTYTDQTYGFTFRYPAEGQIVNQQDHSARISLPFMPGTNLAEKFIDVAVMENADPCVSQIPGVSQSQLLTVNGIPFLEESGADAGAGHFYEWIAYSTSKNNVCASLTFVLHSTNPGNYTTPPPLFDKPAESDVFAPILATFAWLNPDTIVTSCDQAPLIALSSITRASIESPGNQDYFKVSLDEGYQHQVSLEADCDMPLRVDVIENGVVVASGVTPTTSTTPTCKVHVDFTPNGSTICLRVSAVDSAASSDETYKLSIYLNAK